MSDFGFDAAQTLDASQWIAESQKARKATEANTKAIGGLSKVTEKVEKRLGNLGKRTRRTTDDLGGLKRVAAGVFAGFSAGAVIATLKRLASEANRAFLSMDAIRRAAKVTGADLGFLADETNRLGADFEASALRLGQMSIAFQHANLSASHVKESWLAVAEAGTVLGLSAGRQELALLAVQQMASKNVVSMEELKRQLSEQIPGAIGLMAAGLDMTVPKLIKMIESGSLLAETALPALAREMRKTFGPGVADAITSRQAEIGRMRNEFFLLSAAIGEGLPVEPLVADITSVAQAWREWITDTDRTSELLAELVPRIQDVVKAQENLAEQQRDPAVRQAIRDYELMVERLVEYERTLGPGESMTERAREAVALLADKLRDAARAARENAEATASAAEPLRLVAVSAEALAAAQRLIEATSATAAVDKQAEAWHKLLGEVSPGIETLRKLAAQQIAAAEAAEAAEEAAKNQAAAEKERQEVWETSRDRVIELRHALEEYKQLLQDVSAIDAASLLPESILSGPGSTAFDLGSIGGVGTIDVKLDKEEIERAMEEAELDEIWQTAFVPAAEGAGEAIARHMEAAGVSVGQIWQSALTGVVDALLNGGASLVEALSGVARQLGGQIGGAVGAGLGAAAGGILGSLGGPLGAVVGTFVGDLVGDVISSFESTAQGFANAGTHAGGLIGDALEGELSGAVGDIFAAIQGEYDAILELTGGHATRFAELGILLREDSGKLRILIDGIWHQFGDDVQGGIRFAVDELVRRSAIATARPELQQALQAFAAGTADDLNETLALAFRLERGRISPAVAAVEETVGAIMADIGEAIRIGLDPAGGFADLARVKDNLMGVQRSAAESVNLEINAYEAKLDMMAISVRAQLAEARTMGAVTEARALTTTAYAETSSAMIMADNARIQSMVSTADAQAQIVGGSAALILELESILEGIEGLRFTGAERAAAAARRAARRAGGAARRAGGGAARTDTTADLLLQLERLRIARMDESDVVIEEALASFDFQQRLGSLREELDQSSLSALQRAELEGLLTEQFEHDVAERARARAEAEAQAADAEAQAAADARQAILQPWQDAAREALRDTSFLGRVREIEEAARAAREELGPVARGITGYGVEIQEFDEIAAGAAAQIAAIGRELEEAFASDRAGIFGFLQSNLGSIADAKERERVQAAIIAFEQQEFALKVEGYRITLLEHEASLTALGLMTEARKAELAVLLDGLDVIAGNMEGIFAGIADEITGAGQTFAGAVSTAAGTFGSMILPLVNPAALPAGLSPGGMSLDEIEALYGGQLGALMSQLLNLEQQALGQQTDPITALELQFEALSHLFEAFNLSTEGLMERFEALREVADQVVRAPWDDFVDQFAPGGSLSGASLADQLARIRGQIMTAIGAGEWGEAAQLGQRGLQLAQQMGGFQLGSYRQWILGLGLDARPPIGPGGGGSDVDPGGGIDPGGDIDPGRGMLDSLSVFERQAFEQRDLQHQQAQDGRAVATNALLEATEASTRELRLIRQSVSQKPQAEMPIRRRPARADF